MKKYGKDSVSIVKTGVILGVGAGVVTSAGGNAGGVGAMAGMMPVVGSVTGGGMVLGALSELSPKKKKRKYQRVGDGYCTRMLDDDYIKFLCGDEYGDNEKD